MQHNGDNSGSGSVAVREFCEGAEWRVPGVNEGAGAALCRRIKAL
jgi:hypothetical protein